MFEQRERREGEKTREIVIAEILKTVQGDPLIGELWTFNQEEVAYAVDGYAEETGKNPQDFDSDDRDQVASMLIQMTIEKIASE